MSRVLFVLDAPLFRSDGRMAGLQARTYEMARALMTKGHEVIVAEPRGSAPADSRGIRLAAANELKKVLPVDVWVAHPLLVAGYWSQLRGIPLVVDGYEAPFASFLANAAALAPTLGSRVMHEYRKAMAAFLKAVSCADRVLCATESQRILYLSLLCVLGRINPKSFTCDLVLTVPSGASPEPPPSRRAGFSRVDPEVDSSQAPASPRLRQDGPVVLWAGGCYPWFDVDTYLDAMPQVLEGEPRVQFLFVGLGGRDHRGSGRSDHPLANKLAGAISESPRLRACSVFWDWLPYQQRGDAYAASDVGVCTYGDHLETLFSMRTRIIDMIWGGLPVVATRGDALSDYAQQNGAGLTVRPADPGSLAGAILNLLHNRPLRDQMARQARRLAETNLAWDNQIEPLHRYCLNPIQDCARSDALVRRTAARIIQVNDGLLWTIRDTFRRLNHAGERLFSRVTREIPWSTEDRF